MKNVSAIITILFFTACQKHIRIIKEGKDERGLTSVIFIQNKDTVALDYLTAFELDSLKRVLK
jgi:hypothetical protein